MPFSLLQLSRPELEALAASRIPSGLEGRLVPGCLPPAFVASRSIALADLGHPIPWSTTFLVVSEEGARIVGGCGFKTALQGGRVEIGYGIAPAARGQGAATAAVGMLLQRAFEAGAMQVMAEVAPDNLASIRVVQRWGFERIGARTDHDNEHLVQWAKDRGT